MARRSINLGKGETKAKGGFETDERFWTLGTNKESTTTTMAFVHDPKEEDFIKFHTHFFEYEDENGDIKKFFTLCPSMFKKPCPVCDKSSTLWKKYEGEDRETSKGLKMASTIGRKTVYLTNVYIVDDPTTPERNGKTFMTKMTAQAFNKVLAQLTPLKVAGQKRVEFNPFDPYESAHFAFTYIPKTGKKHASYESSAFEPLKNRKDLHPIINDPDNDIDTNENLTNEVLDSAYDLSKYMEEVRLDPSLKTKDQMLEEVGKFLYNIEKHINGETIERDEPEEKAQRNKRNDDEDDRSTKGRSSSRKDADEEVDEKPTKGRSSNRKDADEEVDEKPTKGKSSKKTEEETQDDSITVGDDEFKEW